MPSVSEIEQLLHALKGVVSARAVMASDGRAVEIHVLATSELHPKQIVRNVESALTAGLDLDIDRRIVSVSQLQAGAEPELIEGSASEEDDSSEEVTSSEVQPQRNGGSVEREPSTRSLPDRPVLVGIRSSSGSKMENACEVRLRVDGNEVIGTADGLDTGSGRIDAAARATLEALEKAYPRFNVVLEGASVTTAHGQKYVLVTTHGLQGRQSTTLTGAATLGASPEESAVLACLQAVNRWLGRQIAQAPRG